MSRATIEPPSSRRRAGSRRRRADAKALENQRDAGRVDLDRLGGDCPTASRAAPRGRSTSRSGARVRVHHRPVVDRAERVGRRAAACAVRAHAPGEDVDERRDRVLDRVGPSWNVVISVSVLRPPSRSRSRARSAPARRRSPTVVAREPERRLDEVHAGACGHAASSQAGSSSKSRSEALAERRLELARALDPRPAPPRPWRRASARRRPRARAGGSSARSSRTRGRPPPSAPSRRAPSRQCISPVCCSPPASLCVDCTRDVGARSIALDGSAGWKCRCPPQASSTITIAWRRRRARPRRSRACSRPGPRRSGS